MKKEKVLETFLVITTGFIVLYYVFQVIKPLAKKIAWLWYKLGDIMGFVISKIILAIIFFTFLFPIAILFRLIKKDTMMLKKKYSSYWTIRNYKYTKKDMENVW